MKYEIGDNYPEQLKELNINIKAITKQIKDLTAIRKRFVTKREKLHKDWFDKNITKRKSN